MSLIFPLFCDDFPLISPLLASQESKLLVDFELMKKQSAKAQKPDPTKPIFSSFTHHLTLPESLLVLPPPSSAEPLAVFCGPHNDVDGDCVDVPGLASAMSATTYPHFHFNAYREGTPICDYFHYEAYSDHTIVVLTDGCNWGLKSWLAARNATATFAKFVRENLSTATTAQRVGLVLLHALEEAHKQVIAKSHDIWSVGQTTLLAGVMLRKVSEGEVGGGRLGGDRVFISLSLGDCKSYLYSALANEFEDLSLIFRQDSLDAMDPGGRIGPFQHDGSPDLRNLSLSYTVCSADDMFVVCSDGVHDNLDPQCLGLDPAACGLSSWAGRDGGGDPEAVMAAKLKFTNRWLHDHLIPHSGAPTPFHIVRVLCNHAMELTAKGREEMEANSERRQSADTTVFPGKMDHTTCLVFYARFPKEKVGALTPSLEHCVTEKGSWWKAEVGKQEAMPSFSMS